MLCEGSLASVFDFMVVKGVEFTCYGFGGTIISTGWGVGSYSDWRWSGTIILSLYGLFQYRGVWLASGLRNRFGYEIG